MRRLKRQLGAYGGTRPGALIIGHAGTHGDEPAGLEALLRVLRTLERRRPPFQGELVALAGNLEALRQGKRYLQRDLNRLWWPERVAALRNGGLSGPQGPEDREQVELLETIHALFEGARGPVYFLDLHTSSAPGLPFTCVGDTLPNRSFASRFPVPLILGLEESIDGVLLEYVSDLGAVSLGVEAGQHRSPAAVAYHEAFLWLALLEAGNLSPADLPETYRHRELLRRAAAPLTGVMEVRHLHPVRPADGFRMEPGFRNFQPVAAGQLLARDVRGEVRAPEEGRILLPLYQGLGSEGFFLARRVSPAWLRVSAVLRRLRVQRLLPKLPGVRPHPERRETLLVEAPARRWLSPGLFRLLGYRRHRWVEGVWQVSRRRHELRPPSPPWTA